MRLQNNASSIRQICFKIAGNGFGLGEVADFENKTSYQNLIRQFCKTAVSRWSFPVTILKGPHECNLRKAVPQEYKNLIVQYTVPALMTVIDIMQDEGAKKADRLKAAEMLLERAYGKAIQPVIADVNTNSLVIKLEGQLADWAK